MKSTTLVEAEKAASKIVRGLRADDPRLRGSVLILHEEGTTMFFRYAFAFPFKAAKQDWYAIVTEHHGMLVYGQDNVSIIGLKEEYQLSQKAVY